MKQVPSRIAILVEKKTPRVTYIFNMIFKDILGLSIIITDSKELYTKFDGPRFQYGKHRIENEMFVAAVDLLFEKGIFDQEFSFSKFKDLPCFYMTWNKNSVYNFDLFAAIFFLVTRYEEYLPFIKDKYGRFTSDESYAFKEGFLEKPVVNIWINDFRDKLKARFPNFVVNQKSYKFTPTIDVDAAFAYKKKGFWRVVGGYLKNLRDRNFEEIMLRTRVLIGKESDPFDTFEYLADVHRSRQLNPVYFILFGEYGTNDKNLPPYNTYFQNLIRHIADYADVGIHPSYTSNFQTEKIPIEVKNLSKVLRNDVKKSRQHFLMLTFPLTYRRLIEEGITDDYTLGFAGRSGFRAGICTPYYFYDLEDETVTRIRIHPFTVMEGTLKDYRNLSADEALEVMKRLIDEVKAVDGEFISIWHNESVSDKGRWVGWRKVYEEMVDYAMV